MRRSRKKSDEEAQINITPMLDIVFILLIFFIVTTSFVREFGIDASRPSNVPPDDKKVAEVIAVRINEAGDVTVDDRSTDLSRVRALIESGLAAKPKASVVVVVNRAVEAGVTVTVIDSARAAGARRVSLAEQGG